MNHVGSLLFGLLAAYALVRIESRPRAIVVAAVCLVVCVMFSGTGLSLLVLVLLFGVTQRGLLTTALAVAPPGFAYLAWYLVHADAISSWAAAGPHPGAELRVGGSHRHPRGRLRSVRRRSVVPRCAGRLPVRGQARAARPRGARRRWRRGRPRPTHAAGWVGRFGFGPEHLGTSHYAYINLVLLVLAACLVFDVSLGAIRRSPWAGGRVGLVLFSAYSLHGWNQLTKWHNDFALLTSANDDIVMGIRDAVRGRRADRDRRDAERHRFSDFRASYAGAPAIRDALPDRPADPEWRLEAEGRFFVGVGPDEYGLSSPGRSRSSPGCGGRGRRRRRRPGLPRVSPRPRRSPCSR